jgi:hypothetical protein
MLANVLDGAAMNSMPLRTVQADLLLPDLWDVQVQALSRSIAQYSFPSCAAVVDIGYKLVGAPKIKAVGSGGGAEFATLLNAWTAEHKDLGPEYAVVDGMTATQYLAAIARMLFLALDDIETEIG